MAIYCTWKVVAALNVSSSRSKFRELLSQELEEMENTTSIPVYSAIVPSIQSQMVDLAYDDWGCMS